MVSLLACGCSVGDFDDGATFGDPNSLPGNEASTSGAVQTTGGTENPTGSADDGSTTAAATAAATGTSGADSDSEAAEESTSAASSAGSTGTGAECGNGVVEADEACDGEDLSTMTCADIGTFVGGELACDAACAFDTSGCMEVPKAPLEVCETINLSIPDVGNAVSAAVTVPDGGTVTDATIGVTLTHTFIGDLSIDVEHLGTTVRVYNRECFSEDDMDLVFDDAGAPLSCAASTSGLATLPSAALSSLDGAAAGGVWTFSFQDNAGADLGTVTEICVTVTF